MNFDVLLTVHLSIFISVFNQLHTQNLFYNKFCASSWLNTEINLLHEMKLLVPNYSCLQNPWQGGYRPHIPVLSVLCPQLNLLNPPPPIKIPGQATDGSDGMKMTNMLICAESLSVLY